MTEVQGIDTVQLLENIGEAYSVSDLKVLAFRLNIDFDNVSDQNKSIIVVNLIDYCKRRGRLLELVKQCEKERPHLQWFQKIQTHSASFETVEERIAHRNGLYNQTANLQLVHTMLPSKRQQDYWDILIYVIRHQSDDLSMVDHAEFFLGHYWGNKIFHAMNSEGFIGIAISAYGPVLCTCRVLYTGGQSIMLSRYIDLEMAHLFDPRQKAPQAETFFEPTTILNRLKSAQGLVGRLFSSHQQVPKSTAETSGMMSGQQLRKLLDLLVNNFNSEELKGLSYDLRVEWEILPSGTKSTKTIGLISYLQRYDRLPELIESIQRHRPSISLDDIIES